MSIEPGQTKQAAVTVIAGVGTLALINMLTINYTTALVRTLITILIVSLIIAQAIMIFKIPLKNTDNELDPELKELEENLEEDFIQYQN